MLTPFSVSCSQTHSSMEKSRRDGEPFSSFGETVVERWKKSRFGECRILKWKERERILSEKRDIHDFTEKKLLIMLCKEAAQLKQNYLKRSLNWTEENGECEMLIVLFLKLACSSNPRGWNSISGK